MFRRFPYPGWLVIMLLLWLAASGYYYALVDRSNPERLAALVGKDIHQRLNEWETIKGDSQLLERIYTKQLTESDLNLLHQQPFYLRARKSDTLVFWNSNRAIIDTGTAGIHFAGSRSEGGHIFFVHCDTLEQNPLRTISVAIPIAWVYAFENEYLLSHWVASSRIPPSTKLSVEPQLGYVPVRYHEAYPPFFLQIPINGDDTTRPDTLIILLVIASAICGTFWIHLIARYLFHKNRKSLGMLFIVTAVVGIRALLYVTGLPFNIGELKIFSPQLYASSRLLPSLGDLLINSLLFAWLCMFVFTQTSYRSFSTRLQPRYLRFPFAALMSLSLIATTCHAVHIIHSVVADSMISFEVSDFYAIDGYTIAGLITILLTASTGAILLSMQNAQLQFLQWKKYPLIIVVGLLYCYWKDASQATSFPSYYLLIWLLIFVVLSDVKWLTINRDLLAPKTILWGVFISLSVTMLVQYFNTEKERETRKLFAARVLHQKDPITEYLFIDIAKNISTDPKVRSFLEQPSRTARKELDNRLELLHLQGHMSKYQTTIYLFQENGNGTFNANPASLHEMEQRKDQAIQVSDYLYFIENAADNHYYLARIPILKEDSSTAGILFIDLTLKQENNETVYPELLRPGSISNTPHTNQYDYAIYHDQHLIARYGHYPFPLTTTLPQQDTVNFFFTKKRNTSTLWYKTDEHRSIIVVHHDEPWLQVTTMFSYLFSLLLIIMLITIVLSIWFAYTAMGKRHVRIGHMTLRRRIHYAMLGIVMASFLVIGIATITFFNKRYQESSRQNLQEITRNIENGILQYFNTHPNLLDTNEDGKAQSFAMSSQHSDFQYLINSLAHQYGVDINIFGTTGSLLATSRSAIYDKQLLAPLMRSDAFHELQTKQLSLLIQQEKIGRLSYLSGYIPFQIKGRQTVGYINVPYYASQEELKYQVSNIVVALINLYAFILLLSSLLAVIITNNLTRSLHMIIGKFKHLNLQQNELIDWPYDDEIGLLVQEYNKMVQKVESHALALAQNERESAWREMARQVAHEIKNPLTPMKLNIQYLQQAIKQNHPHVTDLTTRIAGSLIEQIDNLSYIASEFSNFAKMPEARPEFLELNETLERAVELYLNKNEVTVTFHSWGEPLVVYIDKSQLLRVCTNLIQNAIQAIPEGQAGLIDITLGRERQNIILSISDNGNGIPLQLRSKIFKPYFTTKTSGTGLGLAMTRKIIEFWKGSIWFETEENKGTVFFIRLPLHNPDQKADNAEL